MRKFYLKTMLLTAMLLGGVSAWAGDISGTLVHTANVNGDRNNTSGSVDAELQHYNMDANSGWIAWAFAEFSFSVPTGETITKATLTWKGTSPKWYPTSVYYLNAETSINYEELAAVTNATDYRFANSKTWIEDAASVQNGVQITTDVTEGIKALAEAGQSYVIFQFTGNNGGADLYGKASDDAPTLVITTSSAAPANYTVKFVDAAGASVKDPVEYPGLTGDPITVSDEDKATFVADGYQYTYVSDDAEGKVIASNNSTVVTIKFDKVAVADYIVNYLNTENTPLKEGTIHENVVVGTPVEATSGEKSQFMVEGVIYEYSSGAESIEVSATSMDNVINLIFKPVEGVEAFYLQNYENVPETGWTTSVGGRFDPVFMEDDGNKYMTVNQESRNNNGANVTSAATESVVAAGEDFTLIARLKLGASGGSNAQNNTAFNIYDAANSAKILSLAEGVANATAWIINEDEAQTVTVCSGGALALDKLGWITIQLTLSGDKTYLTVKDANGNPVDGCELLEIKQLSSTGGLGKMEFVSSRYYANFAIDDILVRKVIESDLAYTRKSSSNLQGFKTFYSAEQSFEVDKNTSIYIADEIEEASDVAGGSVILHKVNENVIPAGKAVILQTTNEDFVITLTPTTEAGNAAAFENNLLLATDEAMEVPQGYILAYTAQELLAFYPCEATMPTGTVYLPGGDAEAPIRIIIAAEEATAIKVVNTSAKKATAIYNMAGQRVNESYKGIVIKDGNKVMQK